MMLPTDAAMTTRRSSLGGTLAALIGLPCGASVGSLRPCLPPRCGRALRAEGVSLAPCYTGPPRARQTLNFTAYNERRYAARAFRLQCPAVCRDASPHPPL